MTLGRVVSVGCRGWVGYLGWSGAKNGSEEVESVSGCVLRTFAVETVGCRGVGPAAALTACSMLWEGPGEKGSDVQDRGGQIAGAVTLASVKGGAL